MDIIMTRECIGRLIEAGIGYEDALALRRAAMTLHAWFEGECGNSNDYASWAIERDEETDKPFMVRHPHDGKTYRYGLPDREKGARKRVAKIISKYPDMQAYVQTDPRGAPLYIVRANDVPEGQDVGCYYNRGIAVYK
jgi:hypothetical protein